MKSLKVICHLVVGGLICFSFVLASCLSAQETSTKLNKSLDSQAEPAAMTPEQIAAAKEQRIQKAAAAIPALKKHLKKNAGDVAVRAEYAKMLFDVGRAREAWVEVMKARSLEPKNADLASEVDRLMQHFISKNIFAVGNRIERIEAVLGPPTKKSEDATTQRFVYGHWAIEFSDNSLRRIINLRGVTQSHFTPTEAVEIQLDDLGWGCGYRIVSNAIISAHYYKPNESIKSFTEKFVMDRLLGITGKSILGIAEDVIAEESKLIPGAKHTILTETESSVAIEVTVPQIGSEPPQYRLIRLFAGEEDIHRITLTLHGKKTPNRNAKQKWLEIFQAAKLSRVDGAAQKTKRIRETSFKAMVSKAAKPDSEGSKEEDSKK